MAFEDLSSELAGWIPQLPPPLAGTLVNRAWRDICRSRLWSFLVEDAQVFAPALLSTGTVAVTQFSSLVTGNAAASAAWLPLVLNTGAAFTKRQFRVGTSGPIYNITAVDTSIATAIVLTIKSSNASDIGYSGATNAAATYQILRYYYDAPSTDFLRWESFYEPSAGYPLKINKQKTMIDRIDPLRSQQGQAYVVANYRASATGAPQFELWPTPTTETVYSTSYHRSGVNLVAGDNLPNAIPDEFVMARAKMRAGMWAIANQGKIPELRGADWRFFISTAEKDYLNLLPAVKKADEETFMQNLIRRRLLPAFLNDGKYLQSHAPFGPAY